MKNPRIVVLVSSDPSDLYFANQLVKHANVVGILVEQQHRIVGTLNHIGGVFRYLSSPQTLPRKLYATVTQRYYARKAKKISRLGFGKDGYELNRSESCQTILVADKETLNSPDYVSWIKNLRPDAIVVCGTSMLEEPVLSIAPHTLNLHSGLSQKYRGTWTTLWPIYNQEPEYVGYTVHFVTAGIDDGDIIHQGRPVICEDDNHETLYVKVVKLGTTAALKALDDIRSNSIRSYPLEQKGKLYLRSMLTPAIIKSTWQKVDAGLIREYVKCPKSVRLIGHLEDTSSNAAPCQ